MLNPSTPGRNAGVKPVPRTAPIAPSARSARSIGSPVGRTRPVIRHVSHAVTGVVTGVASRVVTVRVGSRRITTKADRYNDAAIDELVGLEVDDAHVYLFDRASEARIDTAAQPGTHP